MACLKREDNHMCNSGVLKCIIQIINNSPCLVLLHCSSLKRSCVYAVLTGQLIPTTVPSCWLPQPPDPLKADLQHCPPALPSICGSPLEKCLPARSACLPATSTASSCVISFSASGSRLLCSSCSMADTYAFVLAVLLLLCLSLVSLRVSCPLLLPCVGAACSKESFPTSCRVDSQSFCPSCVKCLNMVIRGPGFCSAL